MPWCETCARYWSPNSVGVEGTCPTCGRALPAPGTLAHHEPGRGPSTLTDEVGTEAGPDVGGVAPDDDYRAPWHFKLLVVAVVGYLGWRAVEGVQWVLEHL